MQFGINIYSGYKNITNSYWQQILTQVYILGQDSQVFVLVLASLVSVLVLDS